MFIYILKSPNTVLSDIDDLIHIITPTLTRLHGLTVGEILFIWKGDLQRNAQFKTHDAIISGSLNDSILHTWTNSDQDTESSEMHDKCDACTGVSGHTLGALQWRSFNIEKEWVLYVPAQVQLLFQAFINAITVGKSEDKLSYLKPRLNKFYMIYDILLNIYNKNHLGIIQEMNSAELMVNYRSVINSFKLTHSMGITTAFCTNELRWKYDDQDDKVYFDYALQPSALTYETDAGISEIGCLRDCLIIAMRDNLVTLTERSDPLPGETRSASLCTIQGTDIGIPKNSTVIKSYHEINNCEGLDQECPCLQPITLQKSDFADVFLNLTAEEKTQLLKLQQLVLWGSCNVWTSLAEGILIFLFII